ncbi:hypothetical protein NLI96_g5420 [Meripilus lineatus]|uniref:Uncharacterized protein n=1 Tax=Meripilus lineatus TaxID=2056292 RepID=A0AAD5YEU2_9APHY|nr:hypothetical protein NLI96_g5420 [Physisporinus lineatus]
MSNRTNPYAPDEDEATILLERNFIAGDLIVGMGYGIQLVMYTSCALYLWRVRREKKSALYILAYITLLLSVETIFVAVQARTVQVVYIDNRNYPGGPWAYFLATQNLAINVMFYATLFVLTFLSDILVLWRCWVIWMSSGRMYATIVTAVPGVMLLGSFGLGFLSVPHGLHANHCALPMAYGTSYYAISLGVNIILTILITTRLVLYRRSIMARLPAEYASHYVSLAAIIVESAAIYSVFAILFLITYAVNNPTNQVLLAFASAAQQIATYLIIYRLAEGRAWNSSTIAQETLTQMNFAPKDRVQRTDEIELGDPATPFEVKPIGLKQ